VIETSSYANCAASVTTDRAGISTGAPDATAG
jgi:hypothetical protein